MKQIDINKAVNTLTDELNVEYPEASRLQILQIAYPAYLVGVNDEKARRKAAKAAKKAALAKPAKKAAPALAKPLIDMCTTTTRKYKDVPKGTFLREVKQHGLSYYRALFCSMAGSYRITVPINICGPLVKEEPQEEFN